MSNMPKLRPMTDPGGPDAIDRAAAALGDLIGQGSWQLQDEASREQLRMMVRAVLIGYRLGGGMP